MIRVFVGCAANGEDAESQAVLEYTLRKYASRPVEINWMSLRRKDSMFAGWNTQGWATPFTGLRWAIPQLCGYEGRAIYMDSDMILRADIAGLWDQEIPDRKVALIRNTEGKLRCCVMLLDCAAADDWNEWPTFGELQGMRDQHGYMTGLLKKNRDRIGAFEGQWNCIDLKRATGIDDPTISCIHYSSMPHQPHLKHAVPRLARKGLRHWFDGATAPHWRPELEQLFDSELAAAIAAGYAPENYEPAELYGPYRKKSFVGRPLKVRA